MPSKTIKISSTGKVVTDRHLEVDRKDKVKWVLQIPTKKTGTVFLVVFGSSTDPFAAGKVIAVPGTRGGSKQLTIAGLPGTYKYSVLSPDSVTVKDDPNIIIRS